MYQKTLNRAHYIYEELLSFGSSWAATITAPPNMTSNDPNTGVSKYIYTHPSFKDARSPSSPLPALYADLSRQRKSNPAGYRASIEWWRDILLDVTFTGLQFDHDPPPPPPSSTTEVVESASTSTSLVDRTVFKLDEGTKARWTVSGVGRPLGLGTVIADLEKDHTVVPLALYLKSSTRISGPASLAGSGLRQYLPTPSGVASALLVTPARWAASQLFSLVTGGSHDQDAEYSQDEHLFCAKRGDWVCFPLVHRLATTFIATFYATHAAVSPLACLMSPNEFSTHLAAVCLQNFNFTPGPKDVELVLTYLSRDHLPRLVTRDSTTIKFSSSQTAPVEPITDEDRSVILVKQTLHKLSLQITSLETQIAHRNTQIRHALRTTTLKPQAASYLRSRKALETVLAQRLAVQETLSQVVRRIERAKTDVEVIKAYKTSEEVLRSVLRKDELRVGSVERTMEGLAEVLAEGREVEDAMKVGREGVDEDEVMKELRALEGEKREVEEREKKRLEKEHDELQARFNRLRVAQSPLSTPPSEETGTEPSKQAEPSQTAIAE